MKKPVILIGAGEMGGVFARGLLRLGHPLYPVTRGMDMNEISQQVIDPELVLVAVGEGDLHPILDAIPAVWRDKLALLQNELLPNDWQAHRLEQPTVISVWFEKKPGQDAKVIIPSPCFGPHATLIKEALGSMNIACQVMESSEALLFELVLKNIYILTTNIAGLAVDGSVGDLWEKHQDLAREIANEVITLQERMTNKTLDREALIAGMVNAFEGDLEHRCMGRSAPARLERALEYAKQYGIAAPRLLAIKMAG
jgi:ketopantoate reductase